jgi:CAAX prenyl protease-like protein
MSDNASQPPRGRILGIDRDEAAYIFPMAAFLLLIGAGGWFGDWAYPYAYLARAAVVPVLLWFFWRYYTPISWRYWWLGAIFGVLGIVQWIGMQWALETWLGVGMDTEEGAWLYPWPGFVASEPFDPTSYFQNPWALWSWIAVRWATASITVPIMEELFWRDWLWRQMLAPADFKLARVGEWDLKVFLLVACLFAIPHPQWWATAIVWGLMVGGLLAWTRSLGACIVMHGVTNFLLGLYVLRTGEWQWW